MKKVFCIYFHINNYAFFLLKAYTSSQENTIITLNPKPCPSTNLNYLNDIDKEVNMKEMLENTRSIETDIDYEEALTILGTNIVKFVIKKGDKDEADVN
ncbi:fam-a protein [Plasmodium yoelii yoelii]|uniref:Fam-a protein n=2 Tax=Plasmodium yoelii yoelii TaxID=73239 RepID=A0AAE9WJL5_PLAYO|nr:fam-a protein [Plasmodium yoelii yoelii]